MEILRERGTELKTIISQHLFSISLLFEGHLPCEVDKYKLVAEVELLMQNMDYTEWKRDTELPTHVFVDFMSKVRQLPLSEYETI